ncbi:hypothetical protein GWK47_036813 [Chionoecetes opilio]|uniref:Uncharacterized protein n=1 Tax=Chionoecetes opilio TaxID=41210 RepID=A0A8J4YM92_CHIOP|nr:hypothetical protein GWK47_036813 [Chionoecetes opilio]
MSRPPVTVPHRSHKGTVWTDVEEVHCKGWLPSNEKRVMVVCSSCSKRCHSSCEGGSPHTAGCQMFHCNSFRYAGTYLLQRSPRQPSCKKWTFSIEYTIVSGAPDRRDTPLMSFMNG